MTTMKSNSKVCYILRGLPGSGKTTLARKLIPSNGVHLEADMFQVNEKGEYDFRFSRIKESHDKCYESFVATVKGGIDVVVANTFVSLQSMQRYIDSANANGYVVHVITLNNLHGNKSIHGVCEKTMNEMREQFEHII